MADIYEGCPGCGRRVEGASVYRCKCCNKKYHFRSGNFATDIAGVSNFFNSGPDTCQEICECGGGNHDDIHLGKIY